MLLNNMLNMWSNNFIYPIQVVITRSMQFANFLVIRNHHIFNVLDLALCSSYSAMFGGGWLLLMGVAGFANRLSTKVLSSFRVFTESGNHCKFIGIIAFIRRLLSYAHFSILVNI